MFVVENSFAKFAICSTIKRLCFSNTSIICSDVKDFFKKLTEYICITNSHLNINKFSIVLLLQSTDFFRE